MTAPTFTPEELAAIATLRRLSSSLPPAPWKMSFKHDDDDETAIPAAPWHGESTDQPDGWIMDAVGKPVVQYAGCGSHDAQWSGKSLEWVIAARIAIPALLRVAPHS